MLFDIFPIFLVEHAAFFALFPEKHSAKDLDNFPCQEAIMCVLLGSQYTMFIGTTNANIVHRDDECRLTRSILQQQLFTSRSHCPNVALKQMIGHLAD